MRILLIGATGQIGYSLAKALSQTTHHITVLVRDRTKCLLPETVRVLESRALDPQAFRRAMSDIDHVIYSVGLPEQYMPDTSVFERINLGLFRVFLAEMAHSGPPNLTYIVGVGIWAYPNKTDNGPSAD